LGKVKGTSKETREKFWEKQKKYSCPSCVIIDSNLCINKFVYEESLIYLGTKNFEKTKGYSAEWVTKMIRKENKENTVEILET